MLFRYVKKKLNQIKADYQDFIVQNLWEKERLRTKEMQKVFTGTTYTTKERETRTQKREGFIEKSEEEREERK